MAKWLECNVSLPDGDPKYYFAVFFYLLNQASPNGESDIPEDLKPYLEKLFIKEDDE